MTLAEARSALAAALNGAVGVSVAVRARPPVTSPRKGDGWVTVGLLAPAEFFGRVAVTLSALVVLGPGEADAEVALDEMARPLMAAVLGSDLAFSDLRMEPQSVIVGTANTAPLYVVVITLTTEVE